MFRMFASITASFIASVFSIAALHLIRSPVLLFSYGLSMVSRFDSLYRLMSDLSAVIATKLVIGMTLLRAISLP